MSLKQQIDADIKKAMLAKEKDELRALRGIKSMILLAETEKGGADELSKEAELKLLTKAAKQRKDSAEVYQQQGREDLAQVELAELEIISRFMPKQLSSEELEKEIKAIISKAGAKGPQDMGKVMGIASKELAGKADGKQIADKVKQVLSAQG
ncbi:GatB/YqeY domain-containing protein [soil metagenome]